MDNPELCPTCRQPLPQDAKTKPGGNSKLPLCEWCKEVGAEVPASFIVDGGALCFRHWRALRERDGIYGI